MKCYKIDHFLSFDIYLFKENEGECCTWKVLIFIAVIYNQFMLPGGELWTVKSMPIMTECLRRGSIVQNTVLSSIGSFTARKTFLKISFNAIALNYNLAEALATRVPMSFKVNCWIQHSSASFYRPQAHASANYKDSRLRETVLSTCWAEELCPIFWEKGGTISLTLIHYKDPPSLW